MDASGDCMGGRYCVTVKQSLFEHKNLLTRLEKLTTRSCLSENTKVLGRHGATRSFLSSFSDCWSDQRLFKSFLLNSCFAAHACTGAAPPRPPLCCQPEGAELGRTRPSGSPLFIFIYMIFFKALVDPRSAYLTGWT